MSFHAQSPKHVEAAQEESWKVYAHIYIYIHKYISVYIHAYICIYIYVHMYTHTEIAGTYAEASLPLGHLACFVSCLATLHPRSA